MKTRELQSDSARRGDTLSKGICLVSLWFFPYIALSLRPQISVIRINPVLSSSNLLQIRVMHLNPPKKTSTLPMLVFLSSSTSQIDHLPTSPCHCAAAPLPSRMSTFQSQVPAISDFYLSKSRETLAH